MLMRSSTSTTPAMTNFEVMGGTLEFGLAGLPFEVCYYSLDTNAPGYWNAYNPSPTAHGVTSLSYDALYGVTVRKEVADGVDFSLTWGHQAAAGGAPSTVDDLDLLQGAVTVGF